MLCFVMLWNVSSTKEYPQQQEQLFGLSFLNLKNALLGKFIFPTSDKGMNNYQQLELIHIVPGSGTEICLHRISF